MGWNVCDVWNGFEVVGDQEVENRTVSPRSRDLNKNLDAMSLEAFGDKLVAEAVVPGAPAPP